MQDLLRELGRRILEWTLNRLEPEERSGMPCQLRWDGDYYRRRNKADWPLPRPRAWLKLVNEPETEAELKLLRQCVKRGQPFGSEHGIETTAKPLNLESTLRSPGRPRKSG